MLKNILKKVVIVLLFISIVALPVFGFHFYDFGYDSQNKAWFSNWTTISRSVFQENALLTNRQLGGGTTVFLTFDEDDMGNVTEEDYDKVAGILKERLLAMGYSDTQTSVTEDTLLQIDFSEKNYVSATIASISTIGDWKLTGTSNTSIICDATMVEDAYVTTPMTGGYGVEVKFTEDGAKAFRSNVSSLATSGSYMCLMMDDQYIAFPSLQNSNVGETFNLTTYENYSDAAMLATVIKYGALPAELSIERTQALPADIGGGLFVGIVVAFSLILLCATVLLLVKGRTFGIFAVMALLSNIAIFFTAVANAYVMLNLLTLIFFAVFAVFATVLYYYALLKATKGGLPALKKANVKMIWTHAILLALSLILYITVTGPAIYVVRSLLLFTCANFILYFIFIVFGINTVSEGMQLKKEANESNQ